MATPDEKQLLLPAKVGSLTLTLDPSHPNPDTDYPDLQPRRAACCQTPGHDAWLEIRLEP